MTLSTIGLLGSGMVLGSRQTMRSLSASAGWVAQDFRDGDGDGAGELGRGDVGHGDAEGLVLADRHGDGEVLALRDGLGHAEAEGPAVALRDGHGDWLGDRLGDGEAEGDRDGEPLGPAEAQGFVEAVGLGAAVRVGLALGPCDGLLGGLLDGPLGAPVTADANAFRSTRGMAGDAGCGVADGLQRSARSSASAATTSSGSGWPSGMQGSKYHWLKSRSRTQGPSAARVSTDGSGGAELAKSTPITAARPAAVTTKARAAAADGERRGRLRGFTDAA